MSKRYSLHKLESSEELPFSKVEYSKFKFGAVDIASKYGSELAQGFIDKILSKNYGGEEIVVVSSPYSFIPTASYFMKVQFMNELNYWLISKNYDVAQDTKVHRTTSYSVDYGLLDANDRLKLIGGDQFYIDKEFVKNKLVFFLDDIRITGSHERVILKMIEKQGITCNFYLIYFAELTNPKIPAQIENELNYGYVQGLMDVESIIETKNFVFNTRVVKYILNSTHREFQEFMARRSLTFLNDLLNLSIGNSYHKVEEYSKNFIHLREMLNSEIIS
jgi:hypothetical protein